MLGYKGRSNRCEFVAGAAVLMVSHLALAMPMRPTVSSLFEVFGRNLALVLSLILTIVICAFIVIWFWGWTALATRRTRDIGWPAWTGLAGAALFLAAGIMMSPLVFFAWFVSLAVWPGRTSRRSMRLKKAAVFD